MPFDNKQFYDNKNAISILQEKYVLLFYAFTKYRISNSSSHVCQIGYCASITIVLTRVLKSQNFQFCFAKKAQIEDMAFAYLTLEMDNNIIWMYQYIGH